MAFSIEVDETLIERARRGEESAQIELLERFEKPVFNLLLRLTGGRWDQAEDLAQDAFLQVLKSIGSFRAEGSFAGWVRRIATTRFLMSLRSSDRRPQLVALDDERAEPGSSIVEHPAHGERVDLERALASLDPLDRTVVWLYEVEGLTHREIAELAGKSISFSKSRLERARGALRSRLEAPEVANARS